MSVPEVRFPEFEGEWKPTRLKNLMSRVQKDISLDASRTYVEIGVRSHCRGVFHKEPTTAAEIGEKRVFPVVADTLVFNIVFAWEQAVAVLRKSDLGKIASHQFPMFSANSKTADLDFLERLFQRKRGKYILGIASPGGAGRNKTLNIGDLLDFKVPVPSQAEQAKIAEFLGALDTRLEGLRRERALLSEYKTGLMEKIFAQDIRFRADDGSAFPDWGQAPFFKLFEWISTNSLSREWASAQTGKVQNIHYGDIHGKLGPVIHQDTADLPFISSGAPMRAIKDVEFCLPGDVVIADASEDHADIGKVSEIISCREKSLVAGLHTFLARPKSSHIVIGYSGYVLRSWPMRKAIMRVAQGISVLGISKGEIAQLLVPLPQPDEQRKIADALGAIDAKINSVAAQIEKLDAFRQGLLQKMFV